MPNASFLTKIMDWLRAGYPDGIPQQDYVPLIALLARRLSSGEVTEVAAQLAGEDQVPIGNVDIGVVITKITNEMPREEDVTRVRSRLAAGGWPLADPHGDSA